MRTGQTGVLGSQWQTARSPTGSHGGGWMGVGFALRARGQRMGQGMDACLPPPAATAHPAHSTHSLAPALRGPGPGSGSGRLSLATPLLRTQPGPLQAGAQRARRLAWAKHTVVLPLLTKDRTGRKPGTQRHRGPSHTRAGPPRPRSVPTSNRGAPLPTARRPSEARRLACLHVHEGGDAGLHGS